MTSLAVNDKILSCANVCDREQSTLHTLATADARYSGGGGSPMLTSIQIGSGYSIHYGFNVDETFPGNGNTEKDNFLKSFRDATEYIGLEPDTNHSNYYVWDNPEFYTIINAYGKTTQDYNIGYTKDKIVYTIDGNTTTYKSIPATGTQTETIGLGNRQTKIILKGNMIVNTITGYSTSTLHIDGNLFTETLPVAISTNTNTNVIITSSVDGNLNNVILRFTTDCPKITKIEYVSADRDANTTATNGWTCLNNTTASYTVNGIEDTNNTNKNYLIITLDTTPPANEIVIAENCKNSLFYQTFKLLGLITTYTDENGTTHQTGWTGLTQ